MACVIVAVGIVTAPRADGQVERTPPTEAMHSFHEAIEQYAGLRAKLEEPLPSLDDPRRDSWSMILMRRYLASAIRAARPDAAHGSIFGPAAAEFRDTLARAIPDIDLEALDEEGAGVEEGIKVNEPVPWWALSEVPAVLLERLPPLPPAIEYRLVGESLVLWDLHAEIVIDVLPGALVVPWPS